MDLFSMGLFKVWPTFIFVWYAVVALLHIAFAVGVARDSAEFIHIQRRNTALVGSFIWTLATLVGGVFVAAIYWAIHRSNLSAIARRDNL
ncbi:hypothetical protein ACXR0O_13370 [Verrucomicrobiota bacterium sgz303538]